MTFLKALGGGIVVLAILVARLWVPGMGKVFSEETTKGDWILLVGTFGTLLVLVALLFALK